MQKLIDIIEQDYNKRLNKVIENLEDLRTHKETKELMKKLESLNNQFIYNSFYPILDTFTSLENIEHNCFTILNVVLDDIDLYIHYDISKEERKLKDKLNEKLISLNKEPLPYYSEEVLSYEEKDGKYCCSQKDLLSFIDRKEQKEMEQINTQISLLQKFKPEQYSVELFREQYCNFEHYKGFNIKNFDLISDENIKNMILDELKDIENIIDNSIDR